MMILRSSMTPPGQQEQMAAAVNNDRQPFSTSNTRQRRRHVLFQCLVCLTVWILYQETKNNLGSSSSSSVGVMSSVENEKTRTTSSKNSPPLRPTNQNQTTTTPSNMSNRNNNITTAVCHKALFGSVDLDRVQKWATYHWDLGFDHIYIYHVPSVQRDQEGFQNLKALPYVTLIATPGEGELPDKGFQRLSGAGVAQRDVEHACLSMLAKQKVNFVLVADADEYLWFAQHQSIQEFLAALPKNLHYISLGKYMYDWNHYVVEQGDSGYGLDKYAFTGGTFCNNDPGNKECGGVNGRCKLIVNPMRHRRTGIHGNYPLPYKPSRGLIQMNTDVAHMKEWPHAFDTSRPDPVPMPRQNFTVQSSKDVSIHNLFKGHPKNENGTYTMIYDDRLHEWFQYVSNRRKNDDSG